MGGTDDPSNLIELTIEEHAEAHRLLFEQHGQWEDEIAWKGLSGMISKEEIIFRTQSESSKEVLKRNGNPWSGKRTKTNLAINEQQRLDMSEKSKSPEAIEKRKESFKKIGHQQGEKNSQFGKFWITNEHESKMIFKTDSIPVGWRKGRRIR
jgi:hypothetical protein